MGGRREREEKEHVPFETIGAITDLQTLPNFTKTRSVLVSRIHEISQTLHPCEKVVIHTLLNLCRYSVSPSRM